MEARLLGVVGKRPYVCDVCDLGRKKVAALIVEVETPPTGFFVRYNVCTKHAKDFGVNADYLDYELEIRGF